MPRAAPSSTEASARAGGSPRATSGADASLPPPPRAGLSKEPSPGPELLFAAVLGRLPEPRRKSPGEGGGRGGGGAAGRVPGRRAHAGLAQEARTPEPRVLSLAPSTGPTPAWRRPPPPPHPVLRCVSRAPL
ncbi:unnamed protein product [Rangifer tarandus platyrhynchus]|uniref:Uncharacterized protein n=2 Tax=Rangifer tarandus platyrhynchus TaxID=3082113 RepID=A0ABN8ZP27_RANTA|nr:unnamed protein product [Rangifer tarandus platyrhynchus]CAI9709696.1 unnamed protein product [Rangifer tarandus platyrhynchus]